MYALAAIIHSIIGLVNLLIWFYSSSVEKTVPFKIFAKFRHVRISVLEVFDNILARCQLSVNLPNHRPSALFATVD